MHRFLLISCLFILCISFKSFAQFEWQPELEKEISIKIENQEIEKVLDEISSKTGLYFSYDPTVFNAREIVSVNFQDQLVKHILDELFIKSYSFRVLKNQVIITRLLPLDENLPKAENENKTHYKITGHVKDKVSNAAIPYASISLFGKPIGTISNIDGDFELKVPEENIHDTLFISCVGYAQYFVEMETLDSLVLDISLKPIEIRIKEIEVKVTDPFELIDNTLNRIASNYPEESYLMTSFYREVLKQDDKYINVSEAVLNILKASYSVITREDRIRFLKGRKSPDVSPFKWVDFKMQGGPYYITKLDVIKTMDTFLDPTYRGFYSYYTEQLIEYLGRPTYVVKFSPYGKEDFLSYTGKLFIDKETYALVHAEFELSKYGKRNARKSLIRKKPKSFQVRPIDLKYQVTYKENEGKWYLNTAKTSVKYRVKSKRDKVNSIFHSVSELLVTDYHETSLKRFNREVTFNSKDIFTEIITDYDPEFWGHFNIIKPNEDLRNALIKIEKNEAAIPKPTSKPDKYFTKKTRE